LRSSKNVAWNQAYDFGAYNDDDETKPNVLHYAQAIETEDVDGSDPLTDGSDGFISQALEDAHQALSKLYNKTHKRGNTAPKFKHKGAW
jgi:hypothetical protein